MSEELLTIQTGLVQLKQDVEQLGIEPSIPGIGHNQPPEPLPIDTGQLQLGIDSANVFRIELSQERPKLEVLQYCGKVLQFIGKRMATALRWLGEKADKFADAAAQAAGAEIGKYLVRVALLTAALHELGPHFDRIEQTLRTLGHM